MSYGIINAISSVGDIFRQLRLQLRSLNLFITIWDCLGLYVVVWHPLIYGGIICYKGPFEMILHLLICRDTNWDDLGFFHVVWLPLILCKTICCIVWYILDYLRWYGTLYYGMDYLTWYETICYGVAQFHMLGYKQIMLGICHHSSFVFPECILKPCPKVCAGCLNTRKKDK